jgi:hypothetical protein
MRVPRDKSKDRQGLKVRPMPVKCELNEGGSGYGSEVCRTVEQLQRM